MTTIAYDGKTMCADTLMTCNGTRIGYVSKMERVPDGVVGYAGTVSDCQLVIEWMRGGMKKKDRPELSSTADVGIIYVKNTGEVFLVDEGLMPYPTCVPCAEGSGADFALAAMHLGKTSKQAVKLAIKLDCYSGGAIQEETP